jgi:hypothetical protein
MRKPFRFSGMIGISISLQLMSFTEKTVQCRLEFQTVPNGRRPIGRNVSTHDKQQGGVL